MTHTACFRQSPRSEAIGLPRASDGVGRALQAIYRPSLHAPNDWNTLLDKLDRMEVRTAR